MVLRQCRTRRSYGFKRKMITKPRVITIGQLASAAAVNLQTVRYYECIGLMPRPSRTGSGHRSYDEKHVRQLSFIRRARELGFSIEDIRALLMLAAPTHRSCAEVKRSSRILLSLNTFWLQRSLNAAETILQPAPCSTFWTGRSLLVLESRTTT